MSHTLYDRAVVEKIKSWAIDPEVTVLSPDETRRLLEIYADKKGDAPLKLPLIVISRERDATIRLTANRTMTRGGLVFNSENGMSDHLNAVPITLNYIINIYTRTMEEADEYVRNFVFNIINYPKILISIPYNNANKLYASYMTLQDTVTDNSDIPERLIPGQFSRFTLGFTLGDAYLFSYNHRKVPVIEGVKVVMVNHPLTDTEICHMNKSGEIDPSEVEIIFERINKNA